MSIWQRGKFENGENEKTVYAHIIRNIKTKQTIFKTT
jgi:hypothetical protein